METVIIEKELWNEILNQVEYLTYNVELLKKKLQDRDLSEWIDSQQVCSILKISLKTLQAYRETGKISYSYINRKMYYKAGDIKNMLGRRIINI